MRYQHRVSFYSEQIQETLRLMEFAENDEQKNKFMWDISLEEKTRQSIKNGHLLDEIKAVLKRNPVHKKSKSLIDELETFRL